MEIQVILVPYDSGLKNFRMGNGPAYIANFGLRKRGLGGIRTKEVSIDTSLPLEVGTTLQVARALASTVEDTIKRGRFPVVLAGGCMSSIGTLAGLGGPPALIWLDAHGDFNTPDTTVSGFFDGMALATATGRCWRRLTASVPGFRPVPESHAILVGARAFDPIERLLLKSSAIAVIEPLAVRNQGMAVALEPALKRLRERQARVYLHVDLDVLDVGEARANQFSCPGGLTLSEVLDTVRLVQQHFSLAAVAITAYDPVQDHDNKALSAATEIVSLVSTLRAEDAA